MAQSKRRRDFARGVARSFLRPAEPFAIHNARKIDAYGVQDHTWIVSDGRSIVATGTSDDDFEVACRHLNIANAATPDSAVAAGNAAISDVATTDTVSMDVMPASAAITDAAGAIMTPGYVDIHAHGAWGVSFDDGAEGIEIARAGHLAHGTTRQVLSLITNPFDTICDNLRIVRKQMDARPDILGAHLEGPFLASSRKGAHDSECLLDPTDDLVDAVLHAADGCLRQITIAPELPHGISAIRRFSNVDYNVIPAIGHCDADYEIARQGFAAGAGIMTHMFNAMNGLHHRNPGPIPAAVENQRVIIELINDGFHVSDSMVRLGFGFAPHRVAFVTDAMAATDCPDGRYLLGSLDVDVVDRHARLASNGAIAGSTLTLEESVRRAVLQLGMSARDAVEAATLTPAKAFRFDKPNRVTGHPIGLLAPGYAADVLLFDPEDWSVRRVWCDGHAVRIFAQAVRISDVSCGFLKIRTMVPRQIFTQGTLWSAQGEDGGPAVSSRPIHDVSHL